MKANQVTILATLMLAFSTIAAHACSCREFETIQEQIDKHELIFVGESVGTLKDVDEPYRMTLSRKTEFVILGVLKGEKLEKITIFHTEDTGGNCGVSFYEGARYLVFAHKDDEGRFGTSFCSGTRQEVGPYKWSLQDYSLTIRKNSE